MDAPQYTDLLAALCEVPDPCRSRGRRYAWPRPGGTRLTLIAAAMASGERNVRAIGQWVAEHAEELGAALDPPRGRLPSTATLRRALRAVDVGELEDRLARFLAGPRPPSAPPPPGAPPRWTGQALDGKAVRGANRHGANLHLVGLVRHADGVVLGQVAVAATRNEITAAPRLLAGRDLTGTVTTMDALLAQHDLAARIRRQGGHCLMVVKANQPDLFAPIDLLFTAPPPPAAADRAEAATTFDKGHGRLERRRLERTCALRDYLAWREALDDVGIELAVWRIHRRIGMSGGLFVNALLRETGRPVAAEEVARLQTAHARAYARLAGQVRPLPGARELLQTLSSFGVPRAIATSGRAEVARPVLATLDVPDAVPVVTRDQVPHAKPDPDLFLAAAERLGVDAADSVVVGDSIWDLLAARRARALGVGLLSGGYGRAELEVAGAYRVYEDPADLLRRLDEIGVRAAV